MKNKRLYFYLPLVVILLVLLLSFCLSACTLEGEKEHIHNIVTEIKIDSTCTSSGLTEGKYCSICNEVIVSQEKIPMLEHELVFHEASSPTETTAGWHAYETCKKCDYSTFRDIPPLDHTCVFNSPTASESFLKTPATCYTSAVYFISCKCGKHGDETFEFGTPALHIYQNGHCLNCSTPKPTESLVLTLNEDQNTYTVTGINDRSISNVIIPPYYEWKPVTRIGAFAFENADRITNITIPKTVTRIDEGAFKGCTSLHDFTIPDTVEYIAPNILENCISLESLTLPFIGSCYCIDADNTEGKTLGYLFGKKYYEGTYIAKQTIDTRNADTGIMKTIPDGFNPEFVLTTSEDFNTHMYYYIPTALHYITVLAGDVHIGAFESCSSLLKITLAENVHHINPYSFAQCTSLSNIVFKGNVRSIEPYAFWSCKALRNVILPNGLYYIKEKAFYNCSSLENISIPESVSFISHDSFLDCSSLIETFDGICYVDRWVVSYETEKAAASLLPGTVGIAYYAFYSNYELESLSLPDSLKHICCNAFPSSDKPFELVDGICYIDNWAIKSKGTDTVNIRPGTVGIASRAFSSSSIKSVSIPDSVKYIGDFAFRSSNITSINISPNVLHLGKAVFNNKNLSSITVSNDNRNYYSVNNCVVEKGTGTIIIGCSTSIIPDEETITCIGYGAFEGSSNMSQLNIPKNITFIDEYAFVGCSNLDSISVDPFNPVYRSSNNCLIKSSTGTLLLGCNNSTIPNDGSIKHIAALAFYKNKDLESILIPDGVVSIGHSAFKGCEALTTVTIANSVIFLGDAAFASCTNLVDITLSQAMQCIGHYTFYNCKSLRSIIIPENVFIVENNAFYDKCPAVQNINGFLYIGSWLISAQYNSSESIVKEGTIGIASDAFDKGGDITLPTTLKYISPRAFYDCMSLKSISIQEGLLYMGDGAFHYCDYLSEITLPNSLTVIPDRAFASCTGPSGYGLKKVVLGNQVTIIGDYAFYGVWNMKNLNIPDSVISIGKCALGNHGAIKQIWFPSNLRFLGEHAITMTKGSYISIPQKTIYYQGSREDWNKIVKPDNWYYYVDITLVFLK